MAPGAGAEKAVGVEGPAETGQLPAQVQGAWLPPGSGAPGPPVPGAAPEDADDGLRGARSPGARSVDPLVAKPVPGSWPSLPWVLGRWPPEAWEADG
jgi:hypothetical protein